MPGRRRPWNRCRMSRNKRASRMWTMMSRMSMNRSPVFTTSPAPDPAPPSTRRFGARPAASLGTGGALSIEDNRKFLTARTVTFVLMIVGYATYYCTRLSFSFVGPAMRRACAGPSECPGERERHIHTFRFARDRRSGIGVFNTRTHTHTQARARAGVGGQCRIVSSGRSLQTGGGQRAEHCGPRM